MTNEQIQEARRKFLGSRLWRNLEDVEDEAPAFITVDVENGHTLELTLGSLRALKADLERNDAVDLLAACEQALAFWGRYVDRVGPSDSWAVAVRDELRAAVAKAKGE